MYFTSYDAIIAELDRVTQALAFFDTIDAQTMNRKPSPQQWSAAQCLDHLHQSAQSYFDMFDQLLEGELPRNGWRKVPLLPRLFGRLVLQSVDPANPRKNKTLPVFEPTQSEVRADIAAQLRATLQAVQQYARRMDAKGINPQTIVTSPAAAFVNYSLIDCLNILTIHNYRHFNQAKAALNTTAK